MISNTRVNLEANLYPVRSGRWRYVATKDRAARYSLVVLYGRIYRSFILNLMGIS